MDLYFTNFVVQTKFMKNRKYITCCTSGSSELTLKLVNNIFRRKLFKEFKLTVVVCLFVCLFVVI